MMPAAPTPPAAFRLLLHAAAGDGHIELIAGDLHEEFVCLCRRLGRRAGCRWYAGQVLRSIPQLLRLRIRSGECTHLLIAAASSAVPLLLLDRFWRFVYSQIPLKDGLDRAAGFLAINIAAVCVAAAISGAMAPSRQRVAMLSIAVAAGAAIGLRASVGSAPMLYAGALLVAAPASSLVGFAKWRDK